MLYRPDLEGMLPERQFNPPPPLPEALGAWSVAVNLAEIYWSRVSQAQNISAPFRAIAAQNQAALAKYRRQFA
jgi:hypothetical protein